MEMASQLDYLPPTFKVGFPGPKDQRIPSGYCLLLKGPPGVGKTAFGLDFVREGLIQGDKVIYVCLDAPAFDVVNVARNLGFDLEDYKSKGALIMIDFFDRKPISINDVTIKTQRALEDLQPNSTRTVVDSLSTLGLIFSFDILPPWVLHFRARLKSMNSLACLVLDEGVHPATVISASSMVSDGVLEMKMKEAADGELNRFFRVFILRGIHHSTRWIPFKITAEGLKYLLFRR